MENKLTIKKTGGFGMLIDNKELSILYNGKEMMDIKSIDISMRLENAIKATVTIVDANLDLENMTVEVNVDELFARSLLKKLVKSFDAQDLEASVRLYQEAREMTKGMGETQDVSTRDSEYRKIII